MSWKDKLGIFGDRIATEHSVDGTTQNFYVLRTSTALKLKSLGKPIGRLLAVIFEKKDKDVSVKQTTDAEGFHMTDMQASDVAVLKYRGQRMDTAVSDLVALATDQRNMDLIATVIMCSMRDVFDPKDQPDPKDFYEEVDVGQLKDMLIGTIKANAKVFKWCYDEQLKKTRTLAGKVVITFTIGEDGRVTDSRVTSDTVGQGVGQCIADSIRDIIFDRPKGGPETIKKLFLFDT